MSCDAHLGLVAVPGPYCLSGILPRLPGTRLTCSLPPCPLSGSYVDLSGRPKHLWGVYKKMAAKGYTLDRISGALGGVLRLRWPLAAPWLRLATPASPSAASFQATLWPSLLSP